MTATINNLHCILVLADCIIKLVVLAKLATC